MTGIMQPTGEDHSGTTAVLDAVSDQAVDHFHEQGFVHVPRLLTEQEVTRLRAAALDAQADGGYLTSRFMDRTGIVATEDGWERNATLREFALHPRIGSTAEKIARMPLRAWGGEVLVKPAGQATPTPLHDDFTNELLHSRLTLTCWIALVDVPVERGSLCFLPGSHRRGDPYRVDAGEFEHNIHAYVFQHWPGLRWSQRVTVPLRAGDATFHHSRIAHQAGANVTDEARVSFTVTFTDADATYQPQPGNDPLDMAPGQALPDDRYPRVAG
ncbi:MAG TPA: phytanoyl-CoA dioxygenase family protein [Pseudonocardiaceae bacterium]